LIAVTYVKLVNLHVATTSKKKEVKENPYYPVLLSLSDTFNRYRINDNTYRITANDFTNIQLIRLLSLT
jgi:hypothetical protein